jgi:hypothetical protein
MSTAVENGDGKVGQDDQNQQTVQHPISIAHA